MSRVPVILSMLLALTLVFAVAACDDDDDDENGGGNGETADSVDAEAYYEAVDVIQNDLTEQLDIIGEQSQDAFGNPDSAQSALSDAQSVVQQGIEELSALEPAPAAADAHENMISALESMDAALEGMVTDLAGVQTDEEFDDFKGSIAQTDSAYTLAAEEVREACRDMQAAANNSQVDVVYQCPV